MPDLKLTASEVKFWQSEAKSCEERQRIELQNKNNYPFLVNYYEGFEKIDVAHPHVNSEQQLAVINEYFPSTNSLITEIMYKNPDILLEATRPDAEEGLDLMKSALSYFLRRSGSLVENRVALFDMLFAGYCAVEVNQLNENRTEVVKEDVKQPQTEESKKKSIFDQFKRKPKDEEDAEKKLSEMAPPMESNFSTVQGTYIRRYSPLDIPLDWRAERLKDRRYNLKKVWLSKSEFDTRYPDLSKFVDVTDDKFDFGRHMQMQHNRKVLLYEFQIKMRDYKYRNIIISPNYGLKAIDVFDRPYPSNDFNVKIGTLHKYGVLYPVSFAQVNKKMQDELNKYVRHMMDVAQRNNPKYVFDKNKVKEDAKEALRSTRVNDLVGVDGNTAGAVTPLQPTNVSFENKELMTIFQDQKNKLWSVSESRIAGRANAEFATELAIENQSFQERNIDIQEGLRLLFTEELDTAKDLIVKFWDGEVFLKVTGKEKVGWYEPITAPDPNNPNRSIVLNPLADLLTGDYFIDIDIASAARLNRSQELQRMIFFMTQLFNSRQALIEQGKDINIDEIRRISKEFGWNPDKIFVDHQPAMAPNVPVSTGESISPEEDARRQAEAEARVSGAG